MVHVELFGCETVSGRAGCEGYWRDTGVEMCANIEVYQDFTLSIPLFE
jgi:hypothetical protein